MEKLKKMAVMVFTQYIELIELCKATSLILLFLSRIFIKTKSKDDTLPLILHILPDTSNGVIFLGLFV